MAEVTSEISALRAVDQQPAENDYTSLRQRIIRVVCQTVSSEDGSKAIADTADTINTIPDLIDWVLKFVEESKLFSVFCKEDAGKNTILHEAARMGYTEEFKKIKSHLKEKELKKLLQMKNHGGMTALLVAIRNRQIETAEWILRLDLAKDILTIASAYGPTALSAAAAIGSVELIKLIVEKIGGKFRNQLLVTDNSRNTAMHIAACNGHHEVALYLLSNSSLRNTDISNVFDFKNKEGLDPLLYAKAEKQDKFVSRVKEALEKIGVCVDTNISPTTTSFAVELKGDFQLGKKRGQGLDGSVYEATISGEIRAAKLILLDNGDASFREKVERIVDFTNLREFDHPNIVKFYGIVKYYDEVALVIELCDKDLKKFYQDLQGVPDYKARILTVIKDSLLGLQYLHSLEKVHGDIKPQNILVLSGRGKIADFGLTHHQDAWCDMARTFTCWSGWPGTYMYKAPEMEHRESPKWAADMWAMGLTALEALTGVRSYVPAKVIGKKFMPQGVRAQQPPEALQYLSEKNQIIINMVIDYDVDKRLPAEDWLKELENFEL